MTDDHPEACSQIAAMHAQLTAAGWACGDGLSRLPGGKTCWIVVANRGEQKVVGRGELRIDAWQAAAAQVHGMK